MKGTHSDARYHMGQIERPGEKKLRADGRHLPDAVDRQRRSHHPGCRYRVSKTALPGHGKSTINPIAANPAAGPCLISGCSASSLQTISVICVVVTPRGRHMSY